MDKSTIHTICAQKGNFFIKKQLSFRLSRLFCDLTDDLIYLIVFVHHIPEQGKLASGFHKIVLGIVDLCPR